MSYHIKELFLSLQGEGANSGRAAVFCRFAGCNLWSGREADRASAACRFCDTDFVGGARFATAADLASTAAALWPRGQGRRLIVCTGGEPALQLDDALIAAFHDAGFFIAIETNGTLALPAGIDWLCVSPKAGCELAVTAGDELKLVFPQAGAAPADYEALAFDHFFLQPLDGPEVAANTRAAIDYCLAHPPWRLSLQTHKYLGIR